MNLVVLLRARRLSHGGALCPRPLGPGEHAALLLGRRLADAVPGSTLRVLCAGDTSENPALALATRLGADETVRLYDPLLACVDGLGVARALSFALRHLGFDLVLAGLAAGDHPRAYIGPAVAECLDIRHLTGVCEARWLDPEEGGGIRARRPCDPEGGLTLPLPCLLTVAPAADPPSLPADVPAAPLPRVLSLSDVGLSTALLQPRAPMRGTYHPGAQQTGAPRWLEDGAALAQHLRAIEILRS